MHWEEVTMRGSVNSGDNQTLRKITEKIKIMKKEGKNILLTI